jgi:hypothetical protein
MGAKPAYLITARRSASSGSGHGSASYNGSLMRYERVYTVWDLHDGVRTGITDLNGAPHYFSSLFDETADEYSENFKLYPVGPEFMQCAMRYSDIYRAWESKFQALLNFEWVRGRMD